MQAGANLSWSRSQLCLGLCDGRNGSKGLQLGSKFLEKRVQRCNVHWRQVDELYPFGLDSQFLQPQLGVIHSLAGAFRAFQVLTGLFCAGKYEHSLGAAGHCLEHVMSFHFAGAGDCNHAQSRAFSYKNLLIAVMEEPQVSTIIYYYFDRIFIHFAKGEAFP